MESCLVHRRRRRQFVHFSWARAQALLQIIFGFRGFTGDELPGNVAQGVLGQSLQRSCVYGCACLTGLLQGHRFTYMSHRLTIVGMGRTFFRVSWHGVLTVPKMFSAGVQQGRGFQAPLPPQCMETQSFAQT